MDEGFGLADVVGLDSLDAEVVGGCLSTGVELEAGDGRLRRQVAGDPPKQSCVESGRFFAQRWRASAPPLPVIFGSF